jgi:hypothetical protein
MVKKHIDYESQFFASDPRAMPDGKDFEELLAIKGLDSGHFALSALTKEAFHLHTSFNWSYPNSLYRALLIIP